MIMMAYPTGYAGYHHSVIYSRDTDKIGGLKVPAITLDSIVYPCVVAKAYITIRSSQSLNPYPCQ